MADGPDDLEDLDEEECWDLEERALDEWLPDTVAELQAERDYLVENLSRDFEVAQIHGQRRLNDRITEERYFRETAQIMVATEAAGEGINLQFCHLMVNYDIPWNPNRLEQRMGRIHRIGQTEDVYIFNLVATNTREGYVLAVPLKKMETMGITLGDKVFDVVGQAIGSTGPPPPRLAGRERPRPTGRGTPPAAQLLRTVLPRCAPRRRRKGLDPARRLDPSRPLPRRSRRSQPRHLWTPPDRSRLSTTHLRQERGDQIAPRRRRSRVACPRAVRPGTPPLRCARPADNRANPTRGGQRRRVLRPLGDGPRGRPVPDRPSPRWQQ